MSTVARRVRHPLVALFVIVLVSTAVPSTAEAEAGGTVSGT
jgi:hypothetical protein